MLSQEDRQTEMDHRTACQLIILCHCRQSALERERIYRQDPRATWMRLQVCLTRCTWDVAQGLNMMMTETQQISNFSLVASRAPPLFLETLKWWCRRHRFVTRRQRWSHGCNVSVRHWLKGRFLSWNDWLRSSWQQNTCGLSSLRKRICIVEIRRLCAAWRVTKAFQRWGVEVHEQIL